MNNGFGTGCYFGSNVTSTIITGSILSFKVKKSTDKKEITDNIDNFLQVTFTKRKKVANLEILLQGSGSQIVLPEVGDTATMASPWTSEVSGTWGVTDAELDFKSDDMAKVNVEITQWYKSNGTTLP